MFHYSPIFPPFNPLLRQQPQLQPLLILQVRTPRLYGSSRVICAMTTATTVTEAPRVLPVEAERTLESLASSWDGKSMNSDEFQVVRLKGAMTNEVYQINWPNSQSRKVLVRIYGEGVDVFFDRAGEIRTFEFMSKHGQGPRLLGRFSNGRVEEFIHARTLTHSDLRDPDMSALIAAKMRDFHDIEMPGPKKIAIWDVLRSWLRAAKRMCSPEEAGTFRLDALDNEISFLEKTLTRDGQATGFCHNDLQYGNIMFDEETKEMTFIDYEYSTYNPVAYDIANLFCEMAANYHSETPHILDYTKYPGLEERQRFLRAYLSSSGHRPSGVEIDELTEEVENYTLVNHLQWGLWGIISGHVNKIDFNFIEYAKQRFRKYWLRKAELLGSH